MTTSRNWNVDFFVEWYPLGKDDIAGQAKLIAIDIDAIAKALRVDDVCELIAKEHQIPRELVGYFLDHCHTNVNPNDHDFFVAAYQR